MGLQSPMKLVYGNKCLKTHAAQMACAKSKDQAATRINKSSYQQAPMSETPSPLRFLGKKPPLFLSISLPQRSLIFLQILQS